MAWTAPRTWVTGETVTAALMNTHLRDNLLETSAATVTTAGDIAYADAANSMGSRLAIGGTGSVLVSDGSAPVWRGAPSDSDGGSATASTATTSYVNLGDNPWGGFSANISVTTTTGTKALVGIGGTLKHNTAGERVFLSFEVTGATTTAANDRWGVSFQPSNANYSMRAGATFMMPLTAGSNTFTLAARQSSTTGLATIDDVTLWVLAL